MLKEQEKLIAFLALIAVIAGLAVMGTLMGTEITRANDVNQTAMLVLNAKLRILDGAMVGLIGIAGMAAQALFRSSSLEQQQAKALVSLSASVPDAIPAEAQKVEVVNTPDAPVPTIHAEDAANPAPTDEGPPPWTTAK